MGWLSNTFGDLGSGIIESLGGHGHNQIGTLFGTWMNNFNGTTDAFNKSVASQWDFWNANNAYNSPSAVMQRYKEAGLNPNLIYGNGTNAGASGGSPSMSAGGAGAALNYIKAYSDLRQQDAMTQQYLANKNLIRSQTQETDNRNDNLTIQSNILDTERQIIAEDLNVAKDNAEMSKIRLRMLKKAVPAYESEMEHKAGDWYGYWRAFGEAMHGLSPFGSTVSNFSSAFDSGRRR